MFAQDEEDQKPAQDIMTDGIMLIAGGIESIVQQLQLQVTIHEVFAYSAAWAANWLCCPPLRVFHCVFCMKLHGLQIGLFLALQHLS